MRKLFISADIEGTSGIVHWDETDRSIAHDYDYFAGQMTREVAAACEGAYDAGFGEVLVKDGHGSGRNINPGKLPEYARVFRGWARHPFSMMYGLDESFDAVVFTGYHSAAQMDTNPLSHTMTGSVNSITLNGELMSELMMNCLTAAYVGVPVYCVSGDRGLCDWMRSANPNTATVAVLEGVGSGALGMHPEVAVRTIRQTVQTALSTNAPEACLFPMPERFHIEINYKEHMKALGMSYYPGAKQTGARVLEYETQHWFEVLRFFHFVL